MTNQFHSRVQLIIERYLKLTDVESAERLGANAYTVIFHEWNKK
ncbi:MAG TPA: hypothetical protein VNA15_07340 [Candidatus Angelobacter sp.]|nr:hypothetical protein [Candidatus Angelobacter sp.]